MLAERRISVTACETLAARITQALPGKTAISMEERGPYAWFMKLMFSPQKVSLSATIPYVDYIEANSTRLNGLGKEFYETVSFRG